MSDNLLVPGRSRSPVPRLRIPLPTLPNATSEATLRSSLTPEHIRSTIRVPSARNLYEIMHAGDGLPVYQSTPDLFTHRPKTSSISSFTARENLRLEQRLNVGAVGPKRYVDGSSTVRVIGTVPGEEDFRRVIDKLTRITARGGAQDKRLSIEEGRTVTASAEEGETVFGKVNVKNCRTPMVLTVKRSRGKLLIYVSKTVPEPMENLCDARFKGDRVMVTDTGLRFKCTTVFVTFTALEITDFTVTVQFGKQKRITRSTLRETDGFERTSDISMLGLLREKKTSKKDFVSINMRVCASVDRLQTMAERRSQSEKRRKEAIFRYHEHLAQKKESALLMLKRQEIKKQHRMEMQLIHEAKMVEKEKEKGLVTLVTNAVLLESMVGRLESKKAQIAEEKNRHRLVARVQHMIRKFLLHRTPHMIAISLCTHHFAIMLHTLLPADISRIQKNIMLCLRISFQRTKVTTQFGKFYEGVLTLQRAWKTAIFTKKNRFDRLNLIWSQAFGLVLEEACKRKPPKKGKKSKENPTTVYFAISSLRKSQVLMQYYLDMRQKYTNELKEFILSRKAGVCTVPPDFAYAPSLKTMMKLIEKAATFDL